MPIYFAYGANMDIAAMARRCAASKALGPARLAHHRFFIMSGGFASVRRMAGATVHGLVWDLALADVAALDAYEEVGTGLYDKLIQPVIRTPGSVRALLYVGRDRAEGKPRPGYLESIIASGTALGLPAAYLSGLSAILRGGTRGAAFSDAAPPSGPVPGVRPRSATPYDRR